MEFAVVNKFRRNFKYFFGNVVLIKKNNNQKMECRAI